MRSACWRPSSGNLTELADGTASARPEPCTDRWNWPTLGEIQLILDDVVRYYNEVRPHRAVGRRTPKVVYDARAKAQPHTLIHQPHWRVRTDTVDVCGYVWLRYLGRLRHLNVGWLYRSHAICLYVLDDVVTFATEDGEFIGETRIDPDRDYQPKGHGFR